MKLISKERPFSYLLIIVIEVIVGILLTIGGLLFDLAIYHPQEGQPGFAFPLFFGIALMFSTLVIAISAIIVVLRIIYLLVKKNRKES